MPSWVFCTEAGRPLDESRVRKNFALALEAAGLPNFRVYDLRHTFASLLLADGAPITYVAALLGHSKPTTTLQYYAQLAPDWASELRRPVRGPEDEECDKSQGRTTNEHAAAWAPIGH